MYAFSPAADDNPNAAQTYGVSSIPTLMIFKGGEVVEDRAAPGLQAPHGVHDAERHSATGAVKVWCEGDIAKIGQALGLFADVRVQPENFVQDDDGRAAPFLARGCEHGSHLS